MANWQPPKKAAQYFKDKQADTMIKENTIRNLLSEGFPCVQIGKRKLIDVENFDSNLCIHISNLQKKSENIQQGLRKIIV